MSNQLGRVDGNPARWAVCAGELLHSGIDDLDRPTLEEIATLMRLALTETPPHHPDRERFVRYYGAAQAAIVSAHDDLDVLDEAVAVLTTVAEEPRNEYPVRFLATFGLATMAELRGMLIPSAATADAQVQAQRRLVRMMPDDDPAKPEMMASLGSALVAAALFDRDGLALVDEAINWTRKALDLAGDRHPGQAGLLHAAGGALKARYDACADERALAEALRLTSAAVRAAGDEATSSWRIALAELCRAEYAVRRDPAVLDEEILQLRTCLATMPDEGQTSTRLRAGLGNALRARYQVAGQRADLELAIDLMRRAAGELSGDPPAQATVLGNLSATLTLLYELTEDEDVRNESIQVGRAAVAVSPPGSAEELRARNNLAVNHMRRNWQTGDGRALDEAVRDLEAAVDATPEPGADRAGRLNNLGSALFMAFVRTGEREPLDRAISLNREALTMLPTGHPLRPGVLNELGARLRQLYLRFEDVNAIEEAVEVLAESVSLTGPTEPDRAGFLGNHSAALHSLYRANGRTETLDLAIDLAKQNLAASPPDFGGRASLLTAVATTLGTKYLDTRDAAFGRQARAYFLAASQAPDAPSRQVSAAMHAARLSRMDEQWRDAADALHHAVTLLPKVASRRLARADQERQLGNVAGMVRDAGACALRAGAPRRALVTLEQGRGILLAQALENQDDFAALRARHPALADELTGCRDAMAAEPVDPNPTVSGQRYDRYHELAPRWDRLLAEVRALPGFERFLRPPLFDDLRAQAVAGPIVLINVSEIRSDALVLDSAGLRVVELAELTAAEVRERVPAFLSAVDSAGVIGRAARHRVAETLAWLWDVVAGPVLDALGISGPPPAEAPWPRLWWCPTGPLAFLPLHAAGHHDTAGQPGPRTVIDRVVSSYTPTIRALEHARRDTSGDPGRRGAPALAVAVPNAPGSRELPGVAVELEVLRDRLPHPPEELTGPRACRDAVLELLPRHPWAHFACHAVSDMDDPSSSHLLVHDHETNPLTVSHIGRLRLRHAELAYLSACSTGRTGMRLADEGIQLASAFQLAGYRHVVATLWPISDRHAVRLADSIYRGVVADGPASAAHAVHRATRRLRERWPMHPELWAAHIHAGA